MVKDNFSIQAETYATYRPTYPPEVYEFIFSRVKSKQKAWDCGTGNGQMAKELAKQFDKVLATDISQKQLDNAFQADNIKYSIAQAEKNGFAADSFDLITVAQAIHWFQFESFYNEVQRTAKDGALLFVIGYCLPEFEEGINEIIKDFYWNIIYPYWDSERHYVDARYATIPFPFEEIKTLHFKNDYCWTLKQLEGYLNSWSAVQHYIRKNGENPVNQIIAKLQAVWGEKQKLTFPLFTRAGFIKK